MRVLVIDNVDLFTYNLVDELEKKECEVLVYGNVDMKTIDNVVKAFKPKLIVISSGAADEPGISIDVVRAYQGQIPIFGVGLGMHFVIKAFEGKATKSAASRASLAKISHDGKTIFKALEDNFEAGVYNTLSALDVPYSFEVSARNENDVVMGIRHKESFIEGIQFDPSSLLTISGSLIIDNLLKEIGKK